MWWPGRGNSGGSWLPEDKIANMWQIWRNSGGLCPPAFPRSVHGCVPNWKNVVLRVCFNKPWFVETVPINYRVSFETVEILRSTYDSWTINHKIWKSGILKFCYYFKNFLVKNVNEWIPHIILKTIF